MSSALLANPATGNPYVSKTQPQYDSDTVATSATTLVSFFTTPLNNGTTAFGGAGKKTLVDTNVRQSGLLPVGWKFDVRGIALATWTTAATMVADTMIVLTNSVLRFLKGGDTSWLDIPAKFVGGGMGVSGFAATAVGGSPLTVQACHNGDANPDAIYRLAESISVVGGEGFEVQMLWPVAPTPTASVAVTLVLHGNLIKS